MPLKDITIRPGLGELGRIRGGGFDEEKQHPYSLPYFRMTDAPDLIAMYGEQPTRLYWMAPYDEPERVCDAHYELWAGRGLLCRGDGEVILKCVDPATDRPLVGRSVALEDFEDTGQSFNAGEAVPCPGHKRDLYSKCKECKAAIRLRMVIRDPNDPTGKTIANHKVGFYLLQTTSIYNNYRRIMEQLLWLKDEVDRANFNMAGSASLIMIPLILERIKGERSVYDEKAGKRVKRMLDLWDIQIDPVWQQWQAERKQSFLDLPTRIPLPAEVIVLEDDAYEPPLPMDDFDPALPVIEGRVLPPIPETLGAWYNYVVREQGWFKNDKEFKKHCADHYGVPDFENQLDQWNVVWERLHEDVP